MLSRSLQGEDGTESEDKRVEGRHYRVAEAGMEPGEGSARHVHWTRRAVAACCCSGLCDRKEMKHLPPSLRPEGVTFSFNIQKDSTEDARIPRSGVFCWVRKDEDRKRSTSRDSGYTSHVQLGNLMNPIYKSKSSFNN